MPQASQSQHMEQPGSNRKPLPYPLTLWKGIALTSILALVAGQIARLPFFSIMGPMVISILIGMIWYRSFGVSATVQPGVAFSSKMLLRAGIILTGLRLPLQDIANAGVFVVWSDIAVVAFTLILMIALGRLLSIDRNVSVLVAAGTAICGAAAILAVGPLIGAKKEQTAVSVALIAMLGTLGAIAYIFLFPYLGFDSYQYGLLSGLTLHELAHVIAASAAGGDASVDIALVSKLGRVALLLPAALVLGWLFAPAGNSPDSTRSGSPARRKLPPIPWFIVGFLAMSLVRTSGFLPQSAINLLVTIGAFLLAAAMAGLGLGIRPADLRQAGIRPVIAAVIGYAALAGLGFALLLFGL